MKDLHRRLRAAVRTYWRTRLAQAGKQGGVTGAKDTGARAAVTGGRQMSGFVDLLRGLLVDVGFAKTELHCDRALELPGWYRPEKKWDLVLVTEGQLVAAIEFKSHAGPSFGNNYNNRTEEAIGSATDLWAAYREGAFAPSQRPWLGYLMLLEQSPGSTNPVKNREPHFPVFPEFTGASYAKRYELLLTKLVRERLYDSACFLLSSGQAGRRGAYEEPNAELNFESFVTSLLGRAAAHRGVRRIGN
jgi:hypothetical protein